MEIFGLIVLLITAGAVAGITAGLFGNGGGFAVVPALVLLFSILDIESENLIFVAVGTSLACIIFSSARALISHNKKGAVDFLVLKEWAPWLVIGVITGIFIASYSQAEELYLIFAWGVLFYGIYFLFPKILDQTAMKQRDMPVGFARAGLVSFLGGFSALLGIAGGTITVITMSICKRPIYQAVATASGVGLIIGLVGAVGFLILGFNKTDLPFGSLGFINIPAVLIISLVSILTAPIGVEWAHNLEENKLKRLFGLYLLFVSSGMFWKASLSSSII
ncbi:MAG: sulfite exporter TauE/SafE family protein [Pseudomonadota bacterium]|nr:sulfite exporter TauE/SafE family protein [Pseudomonadota bacterium]